MCDAPELPLANHLKTLRLPTILREHDKLGRKAKGDEAAEIFQKLWVRALLTPQGHLHLWDVEVPLRINGLCHGLQVLRGPKPRKAWH